MKTEIELGDSGSLVLLVVQVVELGAGEKYLDSLPNIQSKLNMKPILRRNERQRGRTLLLLRAHGTKLPALEDQRKTPKEGRKEGTPHILVQERRIFWKIAARTGLLRTSAEKGRKESIRCGEQRANRTNEGVLGATPRH